MAYLNGKKLLSVVKTEYVPAVYQEKTISPANFQREVVADSGYAALSKVKINGVLIDPHIPIESVQDNTTKYQKVMPNNVLTYGGLSKLGGLTKKYNQFIKPAINTITQNGMTRSNINDILNYNGTTTDYIYMSVCGTLIPQIINNHKYLIMGINKLRVQATSISADDDIYLHIPSTGTGFSKIVYDTILTASQDSVNREMYTYMSTGVSFSNAKGIFALIDLTTIYGTGNEPSTVDDFLNDYPIFRGYVPYTTGTLDYAYTKKVNITGFNIWDEEWEAGSIDYLTGENITGNNFFRSKNFIPLSSLNCYFKCPSVLYGRVYDSNKNYLGYANFSPNAIGNITTNYPTAYYFRFVVDGTTYNNDICINISNNTLNGTYKPYYNNELLEAKIIAIKQKLVGLGYSADVLGYGLNNVYNYIDLENKQVVLNMLNDDLGSLVWIKGNDSGFYYALVPNHKKANATNEKANMICEKYITVSQSVWYNNDGCIWDYTSANDPFVSIYDTAYLGYTVEQVKQAMSGVPLIFELATPITVDVSDILDNDDVIGLLESGGTITFENDERYNLPSSVTYLVEVE